MDLAGMRSPLPLRAHLPSSPRRVSTEKEIEKLTRDAINSITPSDWKKEVNHVERLQQEYWEKDHLEEENDREFIISLGEESSDSEISDSDDELMTGIEPIIYSEDDS
ncbi:hypothetical protein ACJJTC_009255 [Scirpophaga incertulas]